MPTLLHTKPCTKFRVREMPQLTGTLIKATESRAVVRLDRPERDAEFEDAEGQVRTFRSRAGHTTSWSSALVVDAIDFEPINHEENVMSKTKSAKQPKQAKTKEKTTPVKAEKAKTKAPKAPKADGKLSCIDAAVKVLAASMEAMTTKEKIAAMATKGDWSSPNGQTPAATL